MAQATATAKPYIAIIQTQAGPQAQIWYDDGGRFVGCSHLFEQAERLALPEENPYTPNGEWTIGAALHWSSLQRALKGVTNGA